MWKTLNGKTISVANKNSTILPFSAMVFLNTCTLFLGFIERYIETVNMKNFVGIFGKYIINEVLVQFWVWFHELSSNPQIVEVFLPARLWRVILCSKSCLDPQIFLVQQIELCHEKQFYQMRWAFLYHRRVPKMNELKEFRVFSFCIISKSKFTLIKLKVA